MTIAASLIPEKVQSLKLNVPKSASRFRESIRNHSVAPACALLVSFLLSSSTFQPPHHKKKQPSSISSQLSRCLKSWPCALRSSVSFQPFITSIWTDLTQNRELKGSQRPQSGASPVCFHSWWWWGMDHLLGWYQSLIAARVPWEWLPRQGPYPWGGLQEHAQADRSWALPSLPMNKHNTEGEISCKCSFIWQCSDLSIVNALD